jgi:hypothetical protein
VRDGQMQRERYSTGAEHLRDDGPDERTLVVRAEEMLWSSSALRDRERLEWLLHHDYTGVTRDGVHVTRDEAVLATARSVPRGERDFTEWEFHAMPWPLVLVTYRLADDRGDSRHVSIWDISTGLARLRFHQGTWQESPHLSPVLEGALR